MIDVLNIFIALERIVDDSALVLTLLIWDELHAFVKFL